MSPGERCKIDCKEMADAKKEIHSIWEQMVRKSTLRWVVTIMSGLFIFFGGIGWNSAVKARDERTDNKANIKVFNVKQDMLLQTTREIKDAQKQVQQDLESYKHELKRDRERFQKSIIDAIKDIKK